MAVTSSVCVPQAWGHAVLMNAMPAANQAVAPGNIPVVLRFNSRIDCRRSMLFLIGPDGFERRLEIEEQLSSETLTANTGALTGGSYVLRWQILAEDGHITQGQVPFRVK